MTDAPNGHLLTEEFDSRNYVRLYASVDTGSPSRIPSLWVFLLIVLGMFLVIIAITSFLMQYVQKRRRQALCRLIASSDVDLEALGIRRLQVPQEFIDNLPLFVYVGQAKETVNSATSLFNATDNFENEPSAKAEIGRSACSRRPTLSTPARISPTHRQPDLQKICHWAIQLLPLGCRIVNPLVQYASKTLCHMTRSSVNFRVVISTTPNASILCSKNIAAYARSVEAKSFPSATVPPK